MPGRQPILRGTGQSDADMGGFNILNVGAVGDVQSATLIVEPGIAAAGEVGERGSGLPFSSIAAAVAAAEPGDTILLRPGVHAFDGVVDIFQLPGLFIIGYGAIIKSASEPNENTKFTVRSSAVTLAGMEFDGDVTETPEAATVGCIEVTAPGCTIRDCWIHDQNGYGVHLSETFDAIRIFDCWFETCSYGIVGETETTEATRTTFGVSIKRCNFEHNRVSGIDLIGPGSDSEFTLTRVQIHDNQFTRNDSDEGGFPAVQVRFGAQGVQVHNNSIQDESSGIYFGKVKGGSICNNSLKGVTTNGIWLLGCIGINVTGNHLDGRNSAGVAFTVAPILIADIYAAPNDAGQFVITGNEVIFLRVNCDAISVSNATGIIINSNRLENSILLAAVQSVTVNGNQISTPKTTQSIVIDASNRATNKISITANRFNFFGASINRCIATTDASANVIDDVLIEGNATPVGQVFGTATYGHAGANAATHVVQIGNTPENADVTLGWANQGVPVDQLLVSRSRGSDSTGQRESSNPFRTINAAITAASSGDTVVVEDGVFNERIDAKDGITVRFLPGATLVCSTAGGCIRSTADSQSFYVYHEHTWISCTQNTTTAVQWTHSAAYLALHASVSHTGAGTLPTALGASSGTVDVWGFLNVVSTGRAIDMSGSATVLIHGGLSSAADIQGGCSILGGTFKATNATIVNTVGVGVSLNLTSANATFKQCTIEGLGSTSAAINVSTTGSNQPILRDCVLIAGASATQSISAGSAQTIKLYGQTVANKGSDPPTNVTFVGGGTYDVSSSVTGD